MQSSCLMWTLYKTDEKLTDRDNWFPQGMLDVAILAANTSQLKITLEVTCFPFLHQIKHSTKRFLNKSKQKMPKIDTLDALADEMTSILNTL